MSLINFVLPNKTSSNRSCEHIREQIEKKRMKYATENKEYENIPLIEACCNQNSALLKLLLETGANPNETRRIYGSRCALHFCVEMKWLKGIHLLVKHNALVDQCDNNGRTALDYASKLLDREESSEISIEINKILLKAGSSISGESIRRFLFDDTGHPNFMELVLSSKKSSSLLNEKYYYEGGEDFDDALTLSWKKGQAEHFKVLLKHGADDTHVHTQISNRLHQGIKIKRILSTELLSYLEEVRKFTKDINTGSILDFKEFVQRAVDIQYPIAQLFCKGIPADAKDLLLGFMSQAIETITVSSRLFTLLYVLPLSATEDIVLTSATSFKYLKINVNAMRNFFDAAVDIRSYFKSFLIEKNKSSRMFIHEFTAFFSCFKETNWEENYTYSLQLATKYRFMQSVEGRRYFYLTHSE